MAQSGLCSWLPLMLVITGDSKGLSRDWRKCSHWSLLAARLWTSYLIKFPGCLFSGGFPLSSEKRKLNASPVLGLLACYCLPFLSRGWGSALMCLKPSQGANCVTLGELLCPHFPLSFLITNGKDFLVAFAHLRALGRLPGTEQIATLLTSISSWL
jgi:hypothetical protein